MVDFSNYATECRSVPPLTLLSITKQEREYYWQVAQNCGKGRHLGLCTFTIDKISGMWYNVNYCTLGARACSPIKNGSEFHRAVEEGYA